jgi:2'-hydroxyisoflavone reductase
MMKLVELRVTGNFNAVSPPHAFKMGDLVAASVRESARAQTRVTWVPENFLAKQWKPEDLDLPPWSPMSGETAGASLNSVTLARNAGLRSRPLQETVHDTLQWFHSLPLERQAVLRAGLDARKESDTLAAWHAQGLATPKA